MRLILACAVCAVCVALAAPFLAQAKVGDRPDTPNSGAYVSEINNDWVTVSVNIQFTGEDFTLIEIGENPSLVSRKINEFEERRVFANNEIWDLAEFSCQLYDRTSVLLSQSYVNHNGGCERTETNP